MIAKIAGHSASRRSAAATVVRSVAVSFAAVGIVGFLVLLLGPIAHRTTVGADNLTGEKADAVNATRQVLLAAAGGTAVLASLGFTARTYYLSRRGQRTDRYTKAITQLASDKIAELLGGIYALEYLMRESETDHTTVVAVLAAFIRENFHQQAVNARRAGSYPRRQSIRIGRATARAEARYRCAGRPDRTGPPS